MAMVASRFDIYLVRLDPSQGAEIKKTRPCLVVSPDELNHTMRTVIVAPLTTKGFSSPFRVAFRFKGKAGLIVLDQMRAVDQVRFIRKMGRLDPNTSAAVLEVLQEMFAP
jgi:mRNA interferase MazF